LPQRRPEADVPYLAFRCPRCRVRLRIKAAYAHQRGRCPECGFRIDPLRPRPAPAPVVSTSDEPLGLLPLDEEWPEPAQLETDEATAYDLSAKSTTVPKAQAPNPPPPTESYSLAAGDLPPPPRSKPEAPRAAYRVGPAEPVAAPPVVPHQLAHAVAMETRQPPPPPPRHPFWEGIYGFPLRKENLAVLAFLAFTSTVFALAIALLRVLFEALAQGDKTAAGIGPVLAVLAILFFVTGVWASNMFLAVVDDTAAGNDRVAWKDTLEVIDGVWNLFYLIWLVAFCSVPVLAVSIPLGGPWWIPASVVSAFVFPVVFLSSLASTTGWEVLDKRVVVGFLRQPLTLLLVSAPVLGLVLPLIWLVSFLDVQSLLLLAIAGGVVWAAAFLIYGRLLGRAAWLLSVSVNAKKKRGKPNKQNPKRPPDGPKEDRP
jgi:hypothetical protein